MRSSRYAIRQRRGTQRNDVWAVCGRRVGRVSFICERYVGDVLAVRRQCVGSAWARVCGVWEACGRCVCVWAVCGRYMGRQWLSAGRDYVVVARGGGTWL